MEWDDYFVQMNSFEILNTVINNNFKGWALLNEAMDTNCWNIFMGCRNCLFWKWEFEIESKYQGCNEGHYWLFFMAKINFEMPIEIK